MSFFEKRILCSFLLAFVFLFTNLNALLTKDLFFVLRNFVKFLAEIISFLLKTYHFANARLSLINSKSDVYFKDCIAYLLI